MWNKSLSKLKIPLLQQTKTNKASQPNEQFRSKKQKEHAYLSVTETYVTDLYSALYWVAK